MSNPAMSTLAISSVIVQSCKLSPPAYCIGSSDVLHVDNYGFQSTLAGVVDFAIFLRVLVTHMRSF